ncbi:MAG: adenosylcobinamide-GDP ribazoletransferase [Pseudomonadota bacterium]
MGTVLMRAEALLFLTALQFLTRLPVPAAPWSPDGLGRASRYFPAIGALVGALTAAVWLAAVAVLPAPAAAGLALAAGIALTGALHEDGLADTADALGGHAGRDRALEILRDSRIGTYGTLALVLSLGLRWSALSALAPGPGAIALVLAATLGRAVMVPVSRLMPPARSDGLGAGVATGPDRLGFMIAGITVLVVPALVLYWIGPATLPTLAATALVAVLAASLPLRAAQRRLGGYTGDILGAACQMAEIAVLLTLAALLAEAA